MIYFILSNDLVKIGYSNDPKRRFRSLSTGCPTPCHLIGVTDGGHVEEKQIHTRFAHLRERGEWFRFTSEMNDYLRDNAVKVDKSIAVSKIDHPLTRFLSGKSESLSGFATRVGMSRMQLYRIMNGEGTTTETLKTISAATGGAVTMAALLNEGAAA